MQGVNRLYYYMNLCLTNETDQSERRLDPKIITLP